MTRRIPLLLMALLTSIFCAAAQADPEFDSLQNRYRTLRDDPSRNPEELAETCADLSEYYCYRSVDSAIRYARLGLDEVGDSRSPARAMLLNNLAVPTLMQGDTDRAIELFTQAGEIAEELGEPEFMLNIYSSLGVCYRMKNDSSRALDHYRKALDIALHTDDLATIANLNANVASLYSSISRQEEALEYARKAVEAADRSGDAAQTVFARTTEGAVLSHLKRYEESIGVLREALPLAAQIGSPQLYVRCITPMLLAFDRLGQRDSVACYLQKAEPWLPYIPEQSAELHHIREMEALVLYQKGHYRESLAAYERLRRANEQSDLTPMHRLYSMIGLNHARLGNFREAFDNTREAYLLQDSLFTHTVQQELSDLTVRYRTQEKELEIARLRQAEAEQQSRTMKRTAAFSAALSGLMLLVILLLYLRRRQKRRTEELERLDREREREFADFRRDTDLRLARKYIDGLESERERLARELHDGACNDLLGIGMLLEESLPAGEPLARIRTLLEKSRANLRHVSHALMPPVFRYAALDEMLEDYIAHAASRLAAHRLPPHGRVRLEPHTRKDGLRTLSHRAGGARQRRPPRPRHGGRSDARGRRRTFHADRLRQRAGVRRLRAARGGRPAHRPRPGPELRRSLRTPRHAVGDAARGHRRYGVLSVRPFFARRAEITDNRDFRQGNYAYLYVQNETVHEQ